MKLLKVTAPLLLVLLPMGMLYPIWSNPVSAGEDDLVFYYPLRALAGQALHEGRMPLYNTLEATGQPLMADPQAAMLYPPTCLFAVMGAKLAYSLSIFLAFAIAGVGAYFYLRRLGMVRLAAIVGAVAFMFCGFMVGHRVHLSALHSACYLPWLLWCIETLGRRPLRGMLCLTPVMLLALTAGHFPTLIHMAMVGSAYFLLRARPLGRSLAFGLAGIVLAAAIALPQVHMTAELLANTTRSRIGYAMVGENSFFPPALVLAFFPFLMGSRTPGFYPQTWWGKWHLCELLGYVGLLTLALAAVAVIRLYRKPKAAAPGALPVGEVSDDAAPLDPWRPLVRHWTWIILGVSVFMLGYYLPSYKIIHNIPVLGVVRAPARMVVWVDMGLATLAAVAVHLLCAGSTAEALRQRLAAAARRAIMVVLPLVMLGVLGLFALVGWVANRWWPDYAVWDATTGRTILGAVDLANPAVWVPIATAVVTGLVVRFWLVRPSRRAWALVAVLLADLFFVTRFVDVPAASFVAADPQKSPAAAWLHKHAPDTSTYRVWGLGLDYHDRAAELLLAKTCEPLGFATISNYGPFQAPAQAHLLGFRIFGTSRDWPRLIRTNFLLSMYGVKYIIAAGDEYRHVLDSVRVEEGPPAEPGPNLLTEQWKMFRVEADGAGVLRLATPYLWSTAEASQPVQLEAGQVYRISLDARGLDGGAANDLQADLLQVFDDGSYLQDPRMALLAFTEQIAPEWRHFEWTFRMNSRPAAQTFFRLLTMSEREIEVRNVTLCRSDWPRPMFVGGRLPAGAEVYRRVAVLPPRNAGQEPVTIYENRLARPVTPNAARRSTDAELEALKWPVDDQGELPAAPPDISIPRVGASLKRDSVISIAFIGLYAITIVVATLFPKRGRRVTANH